MIRISVRVRPEQVMAELDPALAHEAAAGVAGVQGVELWDERVSDALYVTLDVYAEERTPDLEEGLRSALGRLPAMNAFLVVAFGEQAPLTDATPDDWAAATTTVA